MIIELSAQAHQAVTLLLGSVLGLCALGILAESWDARDRWVAAKRQQRPPTRRVG